MHTKKYTLWIMHIKCTLCVMHRKIYFMYHAYKNIPYVSCTQQYTLCIMPITYTLCTMYTKNILYVSCSQKYILCIIHTKKFCNIKMSWRVWGQYDLYTSLSLMPRQGPLSLAQHWGTEPVLLPNELLVLCSVAQKSEASGNTFRRIQQKSISLSDTSEERSSPDGELHIGAQFREWPFFL